MTRMDEAAKRRLVGAAVLVALAVIFVPMLVEEGDEGVGEPIVIPDAPDVDGMLGRDADWSGADSTLDQPPLPEPNDLRDAAPDTGAAAIGIRCRSCTNWRSLGAAERSFGILGKAWLKRSERFNTEDAYPAGPS